MLNQKINKFILLDNEEKKLLFKIYIFIWIVRLRLWFTSYAKTKVWSEKKINAYFATFQEKVFKEQILLQFINTASRLIPKASCLTKALAGHTILKFFNCQNDLYIGVKINSNSDFEAHAWLQKDQTILLGGDFSSSLRSAMCW